ncbi:MAG: fimbria major subunit [Paludibacteraceae bacterium]|nr:fimbria major subunit [Paludibacteraceae bacterium]
MSRLWTHILFATASLIALAACNDAGKPYSPDKATDNHTIGEQTLGDSVFLRFRFDIPARNASTRSGLTGETDAGSGDEYAFKDATLVVFKTDDLSPDEDAGATLLYSFHIPKLSEWEFDTQHTGRASYVVAISRKTVETLRMSQMRLFVILNANRQFSTSQNRLYDKDGKEIPAGTTFEDFSSMICSDYGNPTDGFLMTNAPMLSKPGGEDGARATSLTPVKAIFFSNSAAANATLDEITSIIIERAAAKVTLKLGSNPLKDIYINGKDDDIASLGEARWTIDNYNLGFYLTRHISPDWGRISTPSAHTGYRFVYSMPVNGLYRSQYAIDINYDNYTGDHSGTTGTDAWDTSTAANYDYLSGPCNADDVTYMLTPAGNSLYLAENTFSERCLTRYNTTRVVLSVQLLDKDDNVMSGYYVASVTGMNNIYTSQTLFKKALADWFDDQASLYPDLVALSDLDGSDVMSTCLITTDGTTGQLIYTFDTSAPLYSSIETAELNNEITKLTEIISPDSYQYGNKMYYASYIAHFGSAETPWNTEPYAPFSTKQTTTYEQTYYQNGDDTHLKDNFFGRWSVVRDHWYQLTLHSISHVGQPTVPDPHPDTPDDQVNNIITITPGYPINQEIETPQW